MSNSFFISCVIHGVFEDKDVTTADGALQAISMEILSFGPTLKIDKSV